jgi:hypothetical protein
MSQYLHDPANIPHDALSNFMRIVAMGTKTLHGDKTVQLLGATVLLGRLVWLFYTNQDTQPPNSPRHQPTTYTKLLRSSKHQPTTLTWSVKQRRMLMALSATSRQESVYLVCQNNVISL